MHSNTHARIQIHTQLHLYLHTHTYTDAIAKTHTHTLALHRPVHILASDVMARSRYPLLPSQRHYLLERGFSTVTLLSSTKRNK